MVLGVEAANLGMTVATVTITTIALGTSVTLMTTTNVATMKVVIVIITAINS